MIIIPNFSLLLKFRINCCNNCLRNALSICSFAASKKQYAPRQNSRKQDLLQKTLRQSEWLNIEKTTSLSSPHHNCWVRLFQSTSSCLNRDSKSSKISDAEYETYVEVTLDSLTEFFEDLPENEACNKDYDCSYSNGVLTLHLGTSEGTYVLNKQTPNKQIWLSSPVSGPKRYDYIGGQWLYHRDGKGLHRLLEEELSTLFGINIDLKNCRYYSWGK